MGGFAKVSGDKLYWFGRNLSAYILTIGFFPIFLVMLTLEMLWEGLLIVIRSDGSEELSYPWEISWPFFREDDGW